MINKPDLSKRERQTNLNGGQKEVHISGLDRIVLVVKLSYISNSKRELFEGSDVLKKIERIANSNSGDDCYAKINKKTKDVQEVKILEGGEVVKGLIPIKEFIAYNVWYKAVPVVIFDEETKKIYGLNSDNFDYYILKPGEEMKKDYKRLPAGVRPI